MIEEDFFYSKDNNFSSFKNLIKKASIFLIIVISISTFIYITINAYYYYYHQKSNNIEIIKSPENPVKTIVKENNKIVKNLDKLIYDNLVGNVKVKDKKKNIKTIKNPKTPIYKTHKKIVNLVEEKKEDIKLSKNISPIRGMARVQIAATRTPKSAENFYNLLYKKNVSLFSKYKKYITEIDLGERGFFYRLQIGDFKNQIEAENFCKKYVMDNNKTESDCIILD